MDDEEFEYPPLTEEDARILWANVLLKAVEDFKNGQKTKTQEGRRVYKNAKSWIWSDNEEFPSFLFLCDHLGIGARQIRRALRGYELQHRGSEKRIGAGIVESKHGSSGSGGVERCGCSMAGPEAKGCSSTDCRS